MPLKSIKSNYLKSQIADEGMWVFIPSVSYPMDSKQGSQRIKENLPLFEFIDKNFPDGPFAFEPNMTDGRFVFLPSNVSHQGIGICVSLDSPGALEVGQFWYPCEYTQKTISFGPSQVYVPMFTVMSERLDDLISMVQEVCMHEEKQGHFCTFPFMPDLIVTLDGNFMDDLDGAIGKIRAALKGSDQRVQRNGEGLIGFMEHIMR